MAIALGDNLGVTGPLPTDNRYYNTSNNLPWTGCTQVNTALSGLRYTGLTVNINGVEYWYKDGIEDVDLVEKTSGGGTITGGTNGLGISGANVVLGGTLTGDTTINVATHDLKFSGDSLQYSGDYSGSYVARSLVDAAWVTGQTNIHTAGGTDRQIQFNNNDILSGCSCFTYNIYNQVLLGKTTISSQAIAGCGQGSTSNSGADFCVVGGLGGSLGGGGGSVCIEGGTSYSPSSSSDVNIKGGCGRNYDGGNVVICGGVSLANGCTGGNIYLCGGIGDTVGQIYIKGIPAKTSETNILYIDSDGSLASGATSGSGGIAMSGSTASGLTTYVDANTICAQPNLTFDGSLLNITGVGYASSCFSSPQIDGSLISGSTFATSSSSLVSNLNADLLDGLHASEITGCTNLTFGTQYQIPASNAGGDDFTYGDLCYDGTNFKTPAISGATITGFTCISTPYTHTDCIIEYTASSGVTIENNLLKDGKIAAGYCNSGNIDDILNVEAGHMRFYPVIVPNQRTLALAGLGAGNVDDGLHYYGIEYITEYGETGDMTYSGAHFANITVTDKSTDGQVCITNIPVGEPYQKVTARKIWRTKAGVGSGYVAYELATISDNITTTYLDNIPDSGLTGNKVFRKVNTTAGIIKLGSIPIMQAPSIFLTTLGYGAGNSITTANSMVAIGGNAGTSITCGSANTLIGYAAGGQITSGQNNVGIGYTSNYFLTTQCNNVGIGGSYPMRACGSNNIGIGNSTLADETLCHSIAIGQCGLGYMCGSWNTAIGSEVAVGALTIGTTHGCYNVFLGYRSGYAFGNTTNKLYNTIIGAWSGYRIDGQYNVILGSCALYNLCTGSCNIGIGFRVGDNLTTGSCNLYIGQNIDASAADVSCEFKLGFCNVCLLEGCFLGGSQYLASPYKFCGGTSILSPLISGTSFATSSSSLVSNLNADLLDGLHASDLTGCTTIWSGDTANGIATYVDANTICSEPNLTFDGSLLTVTGVACATTCFASPCFSASTAMQATTLYASTGIILYDNNYVRWGSGPDFCMYHNGTCMVMEGCTATAPSAFYICGGCANAGTQAGTIYVIGGTNSSSGYGGGIYINGGGANTGPGGNAFFVGGCSTSCDGGAAVIRGGCSTGTAKIGGAVCICGGIQTSTGVGGAVCIAGGCSTLCDGGLVCIQGGLSSAAAKTGGWIYIEGGGSCSVAGASVIFQGGCSTLCNGGTTFIKGGCTVAGGKPGGALYLVGGNATTNALCGDIAVIGGCINISACICTGIYANAIQQVYVPDTCVSLRYAGAEKFKTVTNGSCITGCGFATDFIAASDCRLKTNITPISSALSVINCLCGVCFNLCDDEDHENRIGLIAQDVVSILPEVVSHEKPDDGDEKYGITDERLGIKYDKLTAVLIEAVKEQQTQITCLRDEVEKLKNEVKKE